MGIHRVVGPAGPVAFTLALAFATVPALAAAPPRPAPAATSGRAVAAKARLAAVRAEIAKIAEARRATAAQRGTIDARLAEQATQLDLAAKAVRETDTAIAAKSASLANLERQRDALAARLSGERAALAALLRASYALDRGSDFPLLLGDADVAAIERALAYSRYFQGDRIARIRALLGEVAQLGKLEASIESDTAALQRQRDQRTTETARLEQARAAQQRLLTEADAELARQNDRLAALRRDAEALDQLLKRLQNVFADIPAQLGRNAPFAGMRGRLPWPVAGTPRSGTGAAADGIVIAAKPGAEVRAIAYGRVAWADFMRGYGILVIIDQGGGWMSLYGGNESALVSAGDWVNAGQPIATVGRNPEQGGAWFGLRHDGNPVDPRGWFAARR